MQRFNPMAELARAKHTFGEHGGVNMSIEASTTFTVLAAETLPEIFSGRRTPERDGCYLYARHFNPTVYALGNELAALESTQAGYCTSSGMGAIAASLLQHCETGDHIVASTAVYGGTHALLSHFLPARAGIRTSFVRIDDLDRVERALAVPRTRVLFVETLANPTLAVADVPRLAEAAHAAGAALVVDNTFCPVLVTPARLGADVVVHSLTKFINGAADIVAGAICGSLDFIRSLMDLTSGALMLLGPTMDPKVAFQISMRLPHLGLRMVEHGRRALEFALRLEEQGLPVVYPGLESHPQHALFASLVNEGFGFGGMLTLDLGTPERANAFMEYLQNHHRFGFMAVSLGYSETLMSCSGSSTSSEMDPGAQRAAGIPPGLVRISLGYTGELEQRWEQLEDALRAVGMLGS